MFPGIISLGPVVAVMDPFTLFCELGARTLAPARRALFSGSTRGALPIEVGPGSLPLAPLAGGPTWWVFVPAGAPNPLLFLNPLALAGSLPMFVWGFPAAPSFGGMGAGPGLVNSILQALGLAGTNYGNYVPGQLPEPQNQPINKAGVLG